MYFFIVKDKKLENKITWETGSKNFAYYLNNKDYDWIVSRYILMEEFELDPNIFNKRKIQRIINFKIKKHKMLEEFK